MTFGERLQELRRKSGMSQDTLAERLEVSRQAVSKWERDETMPETEKVIRIAQLFQVSLDTLLMGKEEPTREAPPRPQYQQPRYSGSGRSFSEQLNQFLRRYGKKAGAAVTAVGAVICVLTLVAYFAWPAFAGSFLGAPLDSFESIVQSPNFEIYVDGEYSDVEEIPSWVMDAVRDELSTGPDYGFGGMMDSALEGMDSMMNNAIRAQASLFLSGLVPGLALMAVGIFMIVKGRKLAAQSNAAQWKAEIPFEG